MEAKVIRFKMKKLKKSEEKDLDIAWARNVKERDNWTCQICKKNLKKEPRNCNAHHIIPRQFKKMRWDINNGITLCVNHHRRGVYSPHQNAIWFFGWMNENKSQQLRYCIQKLQELEKII